MYLGTPWQRFITRPENLYETFCLVYRIHQVAFHTSYVVSDSLYLKVFGPSINMSLRIKKIIPKSFNSVDCH